MAISIKTELDPWMDEVHVRYTLKLAGFNELTV